MKTALINWKHMNNVGDKKSCPSDYFDLGETIHIPANRFDGVPDDVGLIIVGGGAVLQMTRVLETCRKTGVSVVVWGAGGTHQRFYDAWEKMSTIFAPREDIQGYYCVPCVSCMDPAFQIRTTPEGSNTYIGTYENKKAAPFNAYAHNEMSFEEVVNFLRKHKLIVSSSYHGGYWAALMNKKLVYLPFNDKFLHTPFKGVFSKKDASSQQQINAINHAIRIGQREDFLNWSRIRNKSIHKHVQTLQQGGKVYRRKPASDLRDSRKDREATMLLYGPSLTSQRRMEALELATVSDLWVCNEWRRKLGDIGMLVYGSFYVDTTSFTKNFDNDKEWAHTCIVGCDGYVDRPNVYHLYQEGNFETLPFIVTKHFSGDWMLNLLLYMGYSRINVFGWSCTQGVGEYRRSIDDKVRAFKKDTLIRQDQGIDNLCKTYDVRERVVLYDDPTHKYWNRFM